VILNRKASNLEDKSTTQQRKKPYKVTTRWTLAEPYDPSKQQAKPTTSGMQQVQHHTIGTVIKVWPWQGEQYARDTQLARWNDCYTEKEGMMSRIRKWLNQHKLTWISDCHASKYNKTVNSRAGHKFINILMTNDYVWSFHFYGDLHSLYCVCCKEQDHVLGIQLWKPSNTKEFKGEKWCDIPSKAVKAKSLDKFINDHAWPTQFPREKWNQGIYVEILNESGDAWCLGGIIKVSRGRFTVRYKDGKNWWEHSGLDRTSKLLRVCPAPIHFGDCACNPFCKTICWPCSEYQHHNCVAFTDLVSKSFGGNTHCFPCVTSCWVCWNRQLE